MSSDPALVCTDLTCGYPSRTVLSTINASFRPGIVTALLGPNGSGKSTFLKTITKTIPPISGRILIHGTDIGAMSYRELATHIAFVPQEEQVTFGFTVRQVVVMGRLPFSGGLFDTAEDHAAAEAAMAAADCLALESRLITELSGGEKQRVLIARALAQGAQILLMDEPTSHLDVGHQIAIARLLRKLASEGRTVIVAVHDLNLAAAFADEGILLAGGAIGLQADIRKVLSDPLADTVYQVDFRRLDQPDGTLHIFPKM